MFYIHELVSLLKLCKKVLLFQHVTQYLPFGPKDPLPTLFHLFSALGGWPTGTTSVGLPFPRILWGWPLGGTGRRSEWERSDFMASLWCCLAQAGTSPEGRSPSPGGFLLRSSCTLSLPFLHTLGENILLLVRRRPFIIHGDSPLRLHPTCINNPLAEPPFNYVGYVISVELWV